MSLRTDPRRYIYPLIAVVIGAILMFLSNQGPTKTPDGLTIIRSGEQYRIVLERARELSEQSFRDWDNDKELTKEQEENLRQAAAMFDEMNVFAPEKLGPYAASGKAYQILGEYDKAILRLEQCLANRKIDSGEEAKLTAIEANYLLSLCYLGTEQYDKALSAASEAVKGVENAPSYRWAKASALVQLKRVPEAKKELEEALKLNPEHARSLGLMKLIESAKAKPKS